MVKKQDFIHNRDAFLSIVKLMTISYIIALLGQWFGGIGNYIAAFGMVFVSIATFFEFVFYREFPGVAAGKGQRIYVEGI